MNENDSCLLEEQRTEREPVRIEELRRIVKRAVLLRRNAIVLMLAKRFASAMESRQVQPSEDELTGQWRQIESLSQLRALVGGRFRNLKERWVGAGLPLREHRGDRREKANVDSHGWLELASWISRQGYEVRLAGEEDGHLFEIRTGKKSEN